jgi:hypothetical protein
VGRGEHRVQAVGAAREPVEEQVLRGQAARAGQVAGVRAVGVQRVVHAAEHVDVRHAGADVVLVLDAVFEAGDRLDHGRLFEAAFARTLDEQRQRVRAREGGVGARVAQVHRVRRAEGAAIAHVDAEPERQRQTRDDDARRRDEHHRRCGRAVAYMSSSAASERAGLPVQAPPF